MTVGEAIQALLALPKDATLGVYDPEDGTEYDIVEIGSDDGPVIRIKAQF